MCDMPDGRLQKWLPARQPRIILDVTPAPLIRVNDAPATGGSATDPHSANRVSRSAAH
jgi:hypothetical protein